MFFFAGSDTTAHTMAWTLCAFPPFAAAVHAPPVSAGFICVCHGTHRASPTSRGSLLPAKRTDACGAEASLIPRLSCNSIRFYIATHPEVEAEIVAELATAGLLATPQQPRPRPPGYDDLAGLPYLGAAMKVRVEMPSLCDNDTRKRNDRSPEYI